MEMDERESGDERALAAAPFSGFRPNGGKLATKRALGDFLALPAPRAVPKEIFADVYAKNSGMMMPGGVKAVMIFFFVMFLVGCALLFPRKLPIEVLMRLGWSGTADAEVTAYAVTSGIVQYNDGEELPVCRVALRFVPPEGGLVETAYFVEGEDAVPGYAAGLFDASGKAAKPVPVSAIYFPPAPTMAYASGGRISNAPAFVALVALFPIVMIVVVLLHGRKKRGIRRLLSEGTPTVARLTGMEETRVVVNGERQYRFPLRFDRPDGLGETLVKARGERARHYQRCFEEGREMRVLYLPYSPDKVLVLHDVESPAPS